MTYYYRNGDMITKQVGGIPPTNEYVAVSPEGIVRHIINDKVVEQDKVKISGIEVTSANLARNMLIPKLERTRRKTKRCKCK